MQSTLSQKHFAKQTGRATTSWMQLSRKVSFTITDQKLTESRRWHAVVRKTNIPLPGSDRSGICSAQRGNTMASFDQWIFKRLADRQDRVQCPLLIRVGGFLPFFF